jgi:hypothetical protein
MEQPDSFRKKNLGFLLFFSFLNRFLFPFPGYFFVYVLSVDLSFSSTLSRLASEASVACNQTNRPLDGGAKKAREC